MKINHFGTLYIVATPIGHLQDITFRAIEILKTVDCIAAEDTRHSQPLLQHYGIKTPTLSLHEHNEAERSEQLLKRLTQGESIALISDAGTPLISDPGFVFVQKVKAQGITVVPIPGACAAIVALSASGLPTDRFVFEGFLPAKTSQRRQQLERLQHETRTLIFYESPHRIRAALEDMQTLWGGKRIAVLARELTKLYETIHAATLAELIAWIEKDANQERGEMVLIVQGAEKELDHNHQQIEHVLTVLLESLPLKQAVDLAAKITGQRKNELYDRALQLQSKHE